MPYLIRECRGEALRMEAKFEPPFGPGFSDAQIAQAEKIVVTGSSFQDVGEWTRFDLFDKNESLIATRTIPGY